MTKIRDLEQIVDVAARHFGEKGYEAARLEDIAAELGVLKGSLYYYIDSKSELFAHVLLRRLTNFIGPLERIAASDARPTEKLAQVIRMHIDRIASFWPESSQWFAGAPFGERAAEAASATAHEGLELQHRYKRAFADIIREGVADGEFRDDVDISVATLGVLGACNWLTQWYRKDGRLTGDEIADTLVPMLLEGLCSKAPHRRHPQSAEQLTESRPGRQPAASHR